MKEKIPYDEDLSREKKIELLKSVHKDCELGCMNEGDSGLNIMDWAMKCLPQTYIDTKSKWFGNQDH